ncbi:MAG: hypothetical protein NTY94_09630 [Alphaproteobacteria bacterium]|nr:hypothetical protein [Alphaproteobacteria bacterium]
MADVTVLGAGGATVTISLTSADNALAAQAAVNVVNNLNKFGLLDMQEMAGAGSMPAATNFLGGLMLTGKGFSDDTGAQYIFIGANAPGDNLVLGGANFRTVVVAGDGSDLVYANLSQNAQVFYGKNNGTFVNYNGNMTVRTEDGDYSLASDTGTNSTVNLGAGAGLTILDAGKGLGATTVNAAGNATISTFGSSPTVSALANINLTSGDVVVNVWDAQAIINPGAAKVMILSNTNGAATLFGGTGSATVGGSRGMFTGGSAGNNIMSTSTVSGSTTLIGGAAVGAPRDFLTAQGSGNTLQNGSGEGTLISTADLGATGGNIFNLGSGQATVFSAFVGNTFNFNGDGGAQVMTRIGGATSNANSFFDFGGKGDYLIGGFVTALDTFEVGSSFQIDFYNAASNNGNEVTILNIAGGASYFFFDANADGFADIKNSDVTIR